MATLLSIWNQACYHLGRERITSTDEDSILAETLGEMWPDARDYVFRAHVWNCLLQRAALARLVTAPAFGFDYQFQLPADYIRMAPPTDPDALFRVEGGKLLTDEDAIAIRYVARVEDVALYEPHLAAALSARLAWSTAVSLRESSGLQDRCAETYERLLKKAVGVDSVEDGAASRVTAFTWVAARY
jgi:hypothetical protein